MEILYIEDDLVDQIVLKRLIKQSEGVKCQVASDLNEAEVLLQDGSFDIILSDYYLAGDTIEDVLKRFSTLPVFLVSGSDDNEKINSLYGNGLKGHFSKPFSQNDLNHLLLKSSKRATQPINKETANFKIPIIFDFTFLNKIAANSPQIKKEFIQIFIDVSNEVTANATTYLATKNWKEIGHLVHKLKSNLNTMGLRQLNLKAKELEQACLHGTTNLDVQEEMTFFLKRLTSAVEVAKEKLAKLN